MLQAALLFFALRRTIMANPEAEYQDKLIKKLKKIFPDSVILKNDSGYIQGIPDLTIFNENKYAVLEVKANAQASHQPNQDYYIDKLNKMSFARFIYPENEQEVLNELKNKMAQS